MISLVIEKENKGEARYTVEAYYMGFRILLTLPFENGQAIVGLLDKMIEAGFTSKPVDELLIPTQETKETEKPKETEKHMCTIHNIEMHRFEKGNQSWYSHKHDGGWCSGKNKQ